MSNSLSFVIAAGRGAGAGAGAGACVGRALGVLGRDARAAVLVALEAGIGARLEAAAVVLAAAHDEHLLVHDIGGFPDATREDLGLFEDRGLHEIVAVGREEPRRDILGMPPVTSCAGKQVDGSFR